MKSISLLLFLVFIKLQVVSETQFTPYEANIFEGRVGIISQPENDNLRLDIGMTYDLYEIYEDERGRLMLGTDWVVWTRLQSEGRFKFPVETSDYWFGLNMSYVEASWGVRARIAHISSHLVDGYTERSADEWHFTKTPFVYSREFAEISIYYELLSNLRIYLGGSFLFSTIPDGFAVLTPQLGLDWVYPIEADFLLGGFQFRTGYDFKLVDNLSKVIPTHSFQATIGYFSDNDTGVAFGLYGYNGASMHGMFFMEQDKYLGLGTQIYFY